MGVDLANMQLMSKFNKRFRFLLCVIDIFRKYACFVPLKDKKAGSIVDAFQKILDDSNRKTKQNLGLKRKQILQYFFKKMVKR